jgi:hypothetical protein
MRASDQCASISINRCLNLAPPRPRMAFCNNVHMDWKMEINDDLEKRGLPRDTRVCQCSTCFKHVGRFPNSGYCGTPFVLNREGSECEICFLANCGLCAIRCPNSDCSLSICRDCDLCEHCDEYVCGSCTVRKFCTNCNKAFCASDNCNLPMDECSFCIRLLCDRCAADGDETISCQGHNGRCNVHACPECVAKCTVSSCRRCKMKFCLECKKEHTDGKCRGFEIQWI